MIRALIPGVETAGLKSSAANAAKNIVFGRAQCLTSAPFGKITRRNQNASKSFAAFGHHSADGDWSWRVWAIHLRRYLHTVRTVSAGDQQLSHSVRSDGNQTRRQVSLQHHTTGERSFGRSRV